MSRIAVCIPTRNDGGYPVTLGYPLVSLAMQTYSDLTIYVRDEGLRDAYSNRHMRLIVNLVSQKGIAIEYHRAQNRHGAGYARRSLFETIRDEPYVLWLDDDMIIEPDAVESLLKVIEAKPRAGFVQGTKSELDPLRTYHNDINVLNGRSPLGEPVRLFFGDTALLLMRTTALREIDWDVLTRYQIDGLTGEDVAMSLMVSQHYEGWGVPNALGWHLSPEAERWLWEPPSDALQVEILRGKVDPGILRQALPHMAPFIRDTPAGDSAAQTDDHEQE